jgi:foldase protein PrsA
MTLRLSRTLLTALGATAVLSLSACSTSDVLPTGGSAALEVNGETVLTRDQLKKELQTYGSNPDYMAGRGTPVLANATRFPNALTLERLNHHLRVQAIQATVSSLNLQPAALTDELRQEALAATFPQTDPGTAATSFGLLPKADQDELLVLQRNIAAIRTWIDPEIQRQQQALGTTQEYFAKNRDEFQDACVRHVLVASLDEAEAVRERLVAGESWRSVAQVSTDTGSGANAGELPCGPVTQYVPEFAAAAGTLQINELSEPVRTQFGYHVLQVTTRTPSAFNQNVVQGRLEQAAAEALLPKLYGPMEDLKVKVAAEYGTYRSGGGTDLPSIIALTPAADQNAVPTG